MCFYCKCKTTKPSVTTHVVTFDNCVIIIKNVPCEECEECGEKYFSDEVMSRLEKIVERQERLPVRYMSLIIIIKLHKVLSFI
jgi:YgiT-type zinc finger domain-containing protein